MTYNDLPNTCLTFGKDLKDSCGPMKRHINWVHDFEDMISYHQLPSVCADEVFLHQLSFRGWEKKVPRSQRTPIENTI